ncbi:MAG: CDP-6-deoxy-D-xylo-4-hexulose-3-dehydrase [Candidatus Saganbacteria bacterium]|uniref:CDP-6-deoxy-D-xylo-4-hexulose-3-dehydrase n=1 Tax=Candidatus Saganbacteria bacterium TaxID=2575572 RepID=A0A833P3N7_UNCSA|nr:MAG: CDP-6-deoxy-D-xylo-4-hexulose-3-dehydrase [Candidatus Saganbacteria bacterium]
MTKNISVPFGTMSVTEDAKKLVAELLESGRLSSGKYVRRFEEEYAQLIGTKEAVALSSGTDADILALAVLYDYGAKRGDEVIIPALSFVATGNAVLHAGFKPVFVDVELETLNINPNKIEEVITEKTRAIMPVHLMGKPAEMDKIMAIAIKHKLFVIEDAAEAHGSIYKGRNVGTIGDMAAYSLYVAHMISTIEGGVVTTDNQEYAEILRSLRSHGRSCNCKSCVINKGEATCAKRFKNGNDIRFIFQRIGYSSKMNELEAAIGLGNIKVWPTYLARRRENFLYLSEQFKKFSSHLLTIHEEKHETIGPHAFPIIVRKGSEFSRDQLSKYLSNNGIDSRNMFLSMPTQCPGFSFLGYMLGRFPNAEYIGQQGLHIGIHQDIGLKECDYIIMIFERFISNYVKNNSK